ncbi:MULTISPECIES: MauE/DoxX family redox-associated membrane protein [unclassified Microbacterium]|uniref:MauE/DoxX family redox-associated membrane protein n=1 Tax=unclassified Microbacterium TaxID=2609290 RepID=UPI003666641A
MGTALIAFLLPATAVASTLILVGVLVASAIAKLRTPDDAAGWEALGIPAALRRDWLIRLHPIAELVLAAALLLLGGVLGIAAAVVAVLLFAAYLVMVWRAKRQTPDASCACFGERRRITGRTLLRNGWLVLMAVISAVAIGALPLWGGVATLAVVLWPWTLALAAVAVTFVLVQESGSAEVGDRASAGAPAAGGEDELEDYLRSRTPAVPVQLADGQTTTLRMLSERQPVLLLAVSETCGSCTPVIESIDEYRALLPEVSVRFLLQSAPGDSRLASTEEPQTLHDPNRYVGPSLADHWFTPTAVLLGADGLLAGGPVAGRSSIDEFVDDIYESLHGERPPAR